MGMVLLRKMEDRFQADLWRQALDQAGIPNLLRTYEDTAYDGLFISQKGYAALMVEERHLEQAREIDSGLEAQTRGNDSDAELLASRLDYTLLDCAAGLERLECFLGQCLEMSCAAACVSPWMVARTAKVLGPSGIAVCSVVGFPLGMESKEGKIACALDLVEKGADEVDAVINRGLVAGGELTKVVEEISVLAEAVSPKQVKVILECNELEMDTLTSLAGAFLNTPVAFLKTGTGHFGPATLEQVELLADISGGRLGVKAAGGIGDWQAAREMIQAGADRIGASAGYEIWLEARGVAAGKGASQGGTRPGGAGHK